MLAHSLGLRRLDLFLQFERPMAEAELAPYRDLVGRRARGEPVAYLVGRKEFMGLDFEVTPDVLVPNPDTEPLVSRAVEWGRAEAAAGRPLRLADVGTGSGCIAVALAHFLPAATVDASDISAAALTVARRNAERHVPDGRVRFYEGDLLAPLPASYTAIVANLPYLPEEVAGDLPAEVRAQPEVALFGATRLINRLLAAAPSRLEPGGRAFLEVDPLNLEEVDLRGWAGRRLHRDLGGHERVLEVWL